MCKVNYVACVKLILSDNEFNINKIIYFPLSKLLYKRIIRALFGIGLDFNELLNIIRYTLYWRINDVEQDKNSQRKCYSQHSSEEDYRSIISRSRFFRCQRFIADKIRDAAKSLTRWLAYFGGSQIIWLFKTILLQSTYELPSQRTCWIITVQKRATESAQIFRRSNVIYKIINYRRSRNKITSYSQQTTKQIWSYSTSSKYRKNFKTSEKKTSTPSPITLPTIILDRYEILRALVVEGITSLPSNYWIIISQGMLVWAEKFEQISNQQSPTITQIKPEDNSIINILANMVIYEQQEKCYVY